LRRVIVADGFCVPARIAEEYRYGESMGAGRLDRRQKNNLRK